MPSFTSIISVLATVAIAVARPGEGYGSDYQDPSVYDPATATTLVVVATPAPESSSCSSGTTISCCNTQIGGGLLGDVLGGSCSIPNLAVLGVTTGSQCPGGNTYCCPTTQTGDLDINAACLPLLA